MTPEDIEEIKRHFNVVAEGLDQKIKVVAEGVLGIGEQLSSLRTDVGDLRKDVGELRLETNAGFAKTQRRADGSNSGVDSRLSRLEQEVFKSS